MHVEEIAPADVGPGFVARPRSTVVTAHLDDQAVLFDEGTGRLHTLDPIATVVWSCLDGGATLRDVAAELADAFGTDRTVVEADVLALVRNLGEQGVVDGVTFDPDLLEEEPAVEEVLQDDGADC